MRAILVTGAILASITAANAADMALKAPPPPPPVASWTGLYFGGFAGGSWVNGNFGPVAPTPLAGNTAPLKTNGFIGGVYAGYDTELSNKFVLGVRGSVPLGAVNQAVPVPANIGGIPGENLKNTGQWAGEIDATLGYDMGMWLPYVGVGGIFISNKATLNVPPFGSSSNTQTHAGVDALAGIKYRVAQHWAVGVQYNYSSLNSQTYTFGPPFGVNGFAKFHQNSMVGELEYRF